MGIMIKNMNVSALVAKFNVLKGTNGPRPTKESYVKKYNGKFYTGSTMLEVGMVFIFKMLFNEPKPFQGKMLDFIGGKRLATDVIIQKVER